MSLQITTGYGSLVALGVSIGDAAALLSLGQRIGNWLTAESENRDFLRKLDLDEVSIFRRRGLIDIVRFNRLWGSQMTILVNNAPTVFRDEDAEKSLEKLSHFTAIMVCTTAALEAFTLIDVVKFTLKRVLLDLLSTSEYGEDILASSFSKLLNGWRSTAEVRGLSYKARLIRRELLEEGSIVDGLMPRSDSPAMERFLVWLLDGDSDTYTTSSSDVAGVGLCLSKLGIDILGVDGLGERESSTPCRLKYGQDVISELGTQRAHAPSSLFRVVSTTVNLKCPEESLIKFPVKLDDTRNRCRRAWTEGGNAARKVACYLKAPDATRPESRKDLYFVFINRGSTPDHADDDIYALASTHAFVVNKELLDCLKDTFRHEQPSTLRWLLEQTIDTVGEHAVQILDPKFEDHIKIGAFTVFQAFFMGYYYAIFLRLVDTSMLQLETVDGAWGFRSPEFLCAMRTQCLSKRQVLRPDIRYLGRENVIKILSTLLLSTAKTMDQIDRNPSNKDNRCIGVIGRRALLIKSLINPCCTLRDIGSFVLLDVDVSGIPRDINGLVRPGVSEEDLRIYRRLPMAPDNHFIDTSSEDVTFHIEADWDANPDNTLICIRYKGRRITTINPYTADMSFCHSQVPPVANPQTMELPPEAIEWNPSDVLNRREIPTAPQPPIIIRIYNRPRLQYAAVALLSPHTHVRLATNCIKTAIERGKREARERRLEPLVVITGDGATCPARAEDWVEEHERRRFG
ncbi:hypothetical protein GP486_001099 [Trichoglossum hirsutum]|uniref:Uncharacterized protein n=1 Tax=Trichoglossum hirsutum TaxID=265104 RepID=A0A9P8LHJ2_9PEZI|nr:hypothetical protein GP486_001099 [Trichoglossum hirsutum]